MGNLIHDSELLLLISKDTGALTLAEYSTHPFFLFRALVALHEHVNEETLRMMATQETNPSVLSMIARNRRTPKLFMGVFALHPDEVVRAGAAANKNLEPSLRKRLENDSSVLVQTALKQNKEVAQRQ